jgi:mannose-6-phosphate isomerase-like protein (cupin superfamily)
MRRMRLPSFEQFSAAACSQGCEEVIERHWAAGTLLDTHTHPFEVQALVVRGEMWLTEDGRTRHLRPGDRFELEAGVPHAERYGPEGATYWVARRHAAGR